MNGWGYCQIPPSLNASRALNPGLDRRSSATLGDTALARFRRMRRSHGELALDLAFGDKKLRYVCESSARARKALGSLAAADLHARLADLEAIDAVTEMYWVPVRFCGVSVGIEFHPGFRLVAEANELRAPLVGGEVDWDRVGRLILLRIERE